MNTKRARELLDEIERAQNELAEVIGAVARGFVAVVPNIPEMDPIAIEDAKGKIGRPKHAVVEKALKSTREGRGSGMGRFKGHPCCGAKGARHMGGCPQIGKPKEVKPVSARPALTEDQWMDVKGEMDDRDFQSARYALTNNLSPWEVNAAVRSESYQHYLEKRAA